MEINEINKKIEVLKEYLHVDRKKRKRLQEIEQELDQVYTNLYKLNKELKKDKNELEALEKSNLKSLFSEILGSRQQQLEQERQHFLHLVLKHNSHIEKIESLKLEKNILSSHLLNNPETIIVEIEKLTGLKESKLNLKPSARKKLMMFNMNIQRLTMRKKEISEASKEADNLSIKIDKIIARLKAVKKWGPYQMTGKRKNTSPIKKSYIDEANQHIIQCSVAISRLDKELKDIYPKMDLNFSLDHYQQFIEAFYDNLITDWLIQKRLNTTIHGMQKMENKLSRISLTLDNDYKITEKKLNEANATKQAFIVNAS